MSEGTSPAEQPGEAGAWEDTPAYGSDHPAFDTSKAHQARIYDALLGGKDNFAADRAAAEAMIAAYPATVEAMRENRAFLGRAIRFLAAEAGIRQFLDIGTGIPTAGNTHEIAQEAAPESRVVYVDYDPVVLAHARALLTSTPEGATDYIDGDARDAGAVLAKAARTLDFSQPVAVSLVMILHAFSDEDDPHGVVAEFMAAAAPGSYLAITHPASDINPEQVANVMARANEHSYQQYRARSRAEVARFFDRLELVQPGLVQAHQWRPAISTDRIVPVWAAVGRKAAG